jgi:hypothetical protein
MRRVFPILVLSLVAVTCGFCAEQTTTAPRRLTDIEGFPEDSREAVRAVVTAVAARGGRPDHYFASVLRVSDGRYFQFSLRHDSHESEAISPIGFTRSFGDSCGKCRRAGYDPATKQVSRLLGIR